MLHTINVYSIVINHYLGFLGKLYNFLSAQEKAQSKKFVTSDLSSKYIVTRAVLRSILAEHLGTVPQNIEFVKNAYGKPFVRESNVEFNMSHSLDSAYYAMSTGFALGIDVEFFNRKKNIFNIVEGVFSTAELDFFLIYRTINAKSFSLRLGLKKKL